MFEEDFDPPQPIDDLILSVDFFTGQSYCSKKNNQYVFQDCSLLFRYFTLFTKILG